MEWKGVDIKYKPLYEWVREHKVQPTICEECRNREVFLVLANKSGKFLWQLNDYEYLCCLCQIRQNPKHWIRRTPEGKWWDEPQDNYNGG